MSGSNLTPFSCEDFVLKSREKLVKVNNSILIADVLLSGLVVQALM